MLPGPRLPELKRRYPHLKGNFGTAWQNQQREFEDIPAPILFTTNCIMPLRASYADRCSPPGGGLPRRAPHRRRARLFPVIEKALELGGYAQDTLLPGLNGGSTVTTGFARTAVLQHADEIVQAVRDGKLRHFFLVGGCDGTGPAATTPSLPALPPPDTILLTLACGKFRLNDLPLGTVPGTGLPRILDVGQCNDAYSAIRIALALADAFGCGVNDLPLSLVLCWFEQKAVCILIALLALGIRNIRLGPTLPPFLSPGWCAHLQNGTASSPLPPRKPTCRPFWAGEVSFGYFATNPQFKISDSAQGIFPVFIHSTKKWRWGLHFIPAMHIIIVGILMKGGQGYEVQNVCALAGTGCPALSRPVGRRAGTPAGGPRPGHCCRIADRHPRRSR